MAPDAMQARRQRRGAERAVLHGRGLRATPARMAVVDVLGRVGRPMTHAEVAAALGGRWDRATIFRNLVALAEAGLARRTDLGDHVWRFEIASPPQGEHDHPHFLCTQCGAIACIPALDVRLHRGARVPRAVRARAIEVQVRGVCDACA